MPTTAEIKQKILRNSKKKGERGREIRSAKKWHYYNHKRLRIKVRDFLSALLNTWGRKVLELIFLCQSRSIKSLLYFFSIFQFHIEKIVFFSSMKNIRVEQILKENIEKVKFHVKNVCLWFNFESSEVSPKHFFFQTWSQY